MTGIYAIKNNINNKVYIGQSTDIKRRYSEHLRSAQPDKYAQKSPRDANTPIHLAMKKYGVDNFTLETLEEVEREQLNNRERYWIQYFKSNQKQFGYNISSGGQDSFGLSGERHSQAKLSLTEVKEIRMLLATSKLTLEDIAKRFSISKSSICMINTGKTWRDENIQYPLRDTYTGSPGEINPKAKLTNKQVINMRQRIKSGEEEISVIRDYLHIASERSIKSAIRGITFKNLPL